jgi:hypothetical protein
VLDQALVADLCILRLSLANVLLNLGSAKPTYEDKNDHTNPSKQSWGASTRNRFGSCSVMRLAHADQKGDGFWSLPGICEDSEMESL